MNPLSILLLGLLPLAALAAPAAQSCIIPLFITNTLGDEFSILLHNPSKPAVHNQALTYKRGSGYYSPGIYPSAPIWNTTLTNGNLALDDKRGTAFIVIPKDRPQFRRIRFEKKVKTPAKYEALYQCINGKGQRVIRPAGDDAGQVFCVYPEEGRKGEYGLWVKPSGGSSSCIEVIAVVTTGIRPL